MTAGIDYPTLDRAVREVLGSVFPLSFRMLRTDPYISLRYGAV